MKLGIVQWYFEFDMSYRLLGGKKNKRRLLLSFLSEPGNTGQVKLFKPPWVNEYTQHSRWHWGKNGKLRKTTRIFFLPQIRELIFRDIGCV